MPGKPRADWPQAGMFAHASAEAARKVAGCSSFRLFRTGRRALYEGLRYLRPTAAARVWIPAFICRGILPAVEAAGYGIQFYDVIDDLEPDWNTVDLCPGDIVIGVHFFGMARRLDLARTFIESREALLIEDCAHLLMAGWGQTSVGHLGTFAIFSLRKQIPVPTGGMLVGAELDPGGAADGAISYRPTARHAVQLAERLGPAVLGRLYCPLLEHLRATLNSVRSVARWRPEADSKISATTLQFLSKFNLESIAARRCVNYCALVAMVSEIPGIKLPFYQLPPGSIPLALPILVKHAREMAASMWAAGVGVSLWPGLEVVESLDWRKFPGSRRWIERAVLLPIHQDLTSQDLERVRDASALAVKGFAA